MCVEYRLLFPVLHPSITGKSYHTWVISFSANWINLHTHCVRADGALRFERTRSARSNAVFTPDMVACLTSIYETPLIKKREVFTPSLGNENGTLFLWVT